MSPITRRQRSAASGLIVSVFAMIARGAPDAMKAACRIDNADPVAARTDLPQVISRGWATDGVLVER